MMLTFSNFQDFCANGLGMLLTTKQLVNGILLFNEYCTNCSTIGLTNTALDVFTGIKLLDNGKCVKCGAPIGAPDVEYVLDMKRGEGRTTLLAMSIAYMMHKLVYTNVEQQYVSIVSSNAHARHELFNVVYNILNHSPWFTVYLKQTKQKISKNRIKLKNIVLEMSDLNVVVRPRAFAVLEQTVVDKERDVCNACNALHESFTTYDTLNSTQYLPLSALCINNNRRC